MLSILKPDMYTDVSSLFEGLDYHLAVVTVLAGKTPGAIYVDDPVTPRTALLIPSNQHRFYVAGSSENIVTNEAIRRLIAQQFAAQTTNTGVYECIVYYPSDDWQLALDLILKDHETFTALRLFYRLQEQRQEWRKHLPEDMLVRRIDEALLADQTLQNREKVIAEILSESPSIDHFLHHNFGFCAQNGQELIGWCLAEYHHRSRYELGVETIDSYRRRGIATLTASAVIEQAFAEGATEIGWHCWANNTASIATARKIGFEQAIEYSVYYCRNPLR